MKLSRQQLLAIWENGRSLHCIDRALIMLGFAFPNHTHEDLVQLSIGKRDYLLLELREKLYGEKLNCLATCPECHKPVDISFTTKEVRMQPAMDEKCESVMNWNDYQIDFHLPNSLDLAAIAQCANDEDAKRILMERCLEKILQNGKPITVSELSEEAIRAIEQTIAGRDAQA